VVQELLVLPVYKFSRSIVELSDRLLGVQVNWCICIHQTTRHNANGLRSAKVSPYKVLPEPHGLDLHVYGCAESDVTAQGPTIPRFRVRAIIIIRVMVMVRV